jgi:hypothetical protein
MPTLKVKLAVGPSRRPTRDEIIAARPLPHFLAERGKELRSAGRNFVTNACPVAQHKKYHRCVTIDTEKNLWHCNDCDRGGTAIDWVMLENNVSAADAMRMLCDERNSSELPSNKSTDRPAKRLIAKTYDYTDETGTLLFQCVRYEPKHFSQRRPDGKGGWIKNIEGVRRVLYRLPEVIKAQTVVIAEGEKDADNLTKLGFAATTNPMGAGKWEDEYSETLRGKDVVIFGDVGDDKREGEIHVETVIRSLAGVAHSIKHVTLPDGFHDISDYIASLPAERATETIRKLIDETPEVDFKSGNSVDVDEPYPSRNAEAARELQKDIAAVQIDAHELPPAHALEEKRDELTSLTSLGAADYPAPLEQAAFHGLAGDFVRRILPHTEADPVALLIQFLIAYGNVIGRDPHAIADASRHGGNLFAVFTGKTSKSRKGTSWKHVLRLFAHVAPEWRRNCITTGLSSGEGLIWAVRDPIEKMEKGETVVTDPGLEDKRLLVVEEEFSKPLVVADREGSTLSAMLRSAWDGDDVLRIMTKTSPARATGAHISSIGHITREELRSKLTQTASANGFGNRFLWPAVDRSKVLPEGGGSYGIADLVERLQKAVAFARKVGELKRDEAARKLWAQVYPALSAGKPGLLGAITARAEAQVLRLSDLYALLDCSQVVRVEHLKAALEVWRYCEDSARWIFETKTGNRQADRIFAALRVAGKKGKTKEQIRRDEFNGHITSFELEEALRLLFHSCLADRKEEDTGGRRAERWFARPEAREKSEVSPGTGTSTTDTSLISHPAAPEKTSFTTPDIEPALPPGAIGLAQTPSGRSVPVMITKAMEAELKQLGLTQAEIDKLTRQQAHGILAAPAAPIAGFVVDEKGVGEL